MSQDDFVKNAYLIAFNKIPSLAPSDAKYQKVVAIGNMKIGEWEGEYLWSSLHENRTVGTVSNTAVYPLDDDVRVLSPVEGDYVTITNTDGSTTYFETVDISRLNSGSNYCAKNGQNLVFNKTFSPSDKEYGGTIIASIYRFADRLTGPKTEVSIDDPNWLVRITGAELARNDTLKQNQYGNLVGEANSLMDAMKRAEDAQVQLPTQTWKPEGQTW